ncbi:unnamed protein product [Rangifer tarandus platyrhynchus]|uniref:Uncharacterized protein n=1 Tax=Rangifer tarandus platyrhynchus TaxID=3082113 RepID=A0AC59YSM9_RANTA
MRGRPHPDIQEAAFEWTGLCPQILASPSAHRGQSCGRASVTLTMGLPAPPACGLVPLGRGPGRCRAGVEGLGSGAAARGRCPTHRRPSTRGRGPPPDAAEVALLGSKQASGDREGRHNRLLLLQGAPGPDLRPPSRPQASQVTDRLPWMLALVPETFAFPPGALAASGG